MVSGEKGEDAPSCPPARPTGAWLGARELARRAHRCSAAGSEAQGERPAGARVSAGNSLSLPPRSCPADAADTEPRRLWF